MLAESKAEAAYKLGKLAEDRIDYAAANRYYLEAASLQPDNAKFLNDAARNVFEAWSFFRSGVPRAPCPCH